LERRYNAWDAKATGRRTKTLEQATLGKKITAGADRHLVLLTKCAKTLRLASFRIGESAMDLPLSRTPWTDHGIM